MENQKSVVELVKLEKSARPAFREAVARFDAQTKSYHKIRAWMPLYRHGT